MLKKITIISALMLASANVTSAVTLHDSLKSAYQTNDEYHRSIEQFKERIEAFPQALGQFLPSLSASVDYRNDSQASLEKGDENKDPSNSKKFTKSLQISQNIFSGGQSSASLKMAKYAYLSAKHQFYAEEKKFVLNAVQKYLEAIELREKLRIHKEDLKFYAKTLSSTKNKFNVGQATRTDIAQAEAAFSKAKGEEAALEAQKVQADMEFKQFFNIEPEKLEWPLIPKKSYKSFAEFKEQAIKVSPELKIAQSQFNISKAGIMKLSGALLPRLDFLAQISDVNNNSKTPFGSQANDTHDVTTSVKLTIPIFEQGGIEHSKVRVGKAQSRQAAHALEKTKKDFETQIHYYWEHFKASEKQYDSSKETVRAYQMVLDSTKKEENFGNKSILEVLEAKRHLSKAEIENLAAHKGYVLLSYSTHMLMGNFRANKLGLKINVFDPSKEFKKAKFKLIGF